LQRANDAGGGEGVVWCDTSAGGLLRDVRCSKLEFVLVLGVVVLLL
jgi:hypothetical protein